MFDLLYLNGESLLRKTLRERRVALHESFTAIEGRLHFADHKNLRDTEAIQDYLLESIKGS